MRTFLLMLIGLLPLHLSANEVVENTNIDLLPDTFGIGDFQFRVFQDPEATNPTSIWFDVTGLFVEEGVFFITLQFVSTNIDEASDWFVVQYGDAFTESNIANEAFEFWGGVIPDGGGLLLDNEIAVPFASISKQDFLPVYLGVNTGGKGFGSRGIFGWVELQITSSRQLEVTESAMSYGASGITVGRNFLFGDVNCDGNTDLLDIMPFVDLLSSGQFAASADFDNDGLITLLDVEPFVEAISRH